MLAFAKIVAFAATVDGAKSRPFYENVLGLKFVSEDQHAAVYDVRGVELRVQKLATFTPQAHTVLGWYRSHRSIASWRGCRTKVWFRAICFSGPGRPGNLDCAIRSQSRVVQRS
jgi:hypothetical protein